MSINPHSHQIYQKPPISPILGLGIAILAVSASSIFIRMAQQEASSMVIAAYRLAFSSVLLAGPAFLKNTQEMRRLSRKEWLLILLSGLFLAIHFASWITSLEYTSIASSVVIVTSSPLWVALISSLILRERIPVPVRWGLGIAILGGILVGGAETIQSGHWQVLFTAKSNLWGEFLALLGAIFVAGYLIIGRRMRQSISLLTYTFLVYSSAAFFLLLLVLGMQLPLVGYSPILYILFAAMAIFPQLIGHSTFNWALKYLPATSVAIATLGEPVGATLLGFLILKESPHMLEIAGGLVILMGIGLALLSDTPRPVSYPGRENDPGDASD